MELAPLSKKDLPDLAKLLKLSEPGLDFVDEAVLEAQTFSDPDHDISYLIKAVDGKAMLGAALGVARRKEQGRAGFFKAFAVHPKSRRKGVGGLLFSELERRFQKRGCREVNVGHCGAPYLQGGVGITDTPTVCFLLKRGYQRLGTVVDMMAPLKGFEADYSAEDKALIKAKGIRKATAKDEAAVLAMVQAAFPSWRYEALAGLAKGGLYIAEQKGKVTAFGCAGATNPGWFGPIGTLESERGSGIGRLLMWKCFEQLKKEGWKEARVPWVGPIPFYVRYVGASLGPVYWHFQKHV